MEMEMEVALEPLLERVAAAAAQLEQAAERLVAVELQASHAGREVELEQRLAEAEATIVSLKAAAAGRKTLPATGLALAAKDGVAIEAGALDTALTGLSIEQRIAVKAGLMRSGLLG